MKKILLLFFVCTVALGGWSCKCRTTQHTGSRMIATPTPTRAAGQTDVLQLTADPIPVVRVGVIGLGMRGLSAVSNMAYMDGVQIVALCDMLPENTARTNDLLERRGHPRALEFHSDPEAWRELSALPDIDLIYIVTDWESHARMGLQGMRDGKHVAIEVPAAMTMDEIWALIDMSEKTRLHCMMLENCVYDHFELTVLNMAQQGLFGTIAHGEGGYIHQLEQFWDSYWDDWRLKYNRTHRGDLYPTHGIGPVALAMNIHRSDKMNFLVSVDADAVSIPNFLREKRGEQVTEFRNGEHTTTLIRTEMGRSMMIQHNVASPRTYSRLFQLSGSKGFANKYPIQQFYFAENTAADGILDHENLDSHSAISGEARQALLAHYKHPIVKDIEELALRVGGHGGMDFIMDYRLIYCLQRGLPLDMDVYDMAEWCCLIPLSEISLDNGSAPVEIPDFTRGAWNRLSGVHFAME